MNTIPFIAVKYTNVELNPISGQRSNTPWLNCADVDAEQCMVAMESVGGAALTGSLVVTLETGVDGTSGIALPVSISSVSTLTAAAPVSPPIDVSGVGSIRARITTANGSAAKGRFKFLFRRRDGFGEELANVLQGGEGLLTGSAGVASGTPSGETGAVGPEL